MEIIPTAGAATPPATREQTERTEQAPTADMAGDFETFLTLLTAQMRNQDPLKPMESTEFVAQLAEFSAVEQQVRSNDRLDRIIEVLAGTATDGLAAWIGREVRAPGKAEYTGAAIGVGIAPSPDADRAVLVVRNDFDQVVARQSVDADAELASWDGRNSDGAALPHGRYSFAVESYSGETQIGSEAGRVFAEVSEVRLGPDGPLLMTSTGSEVPLASVTAVR